MPAVQSDERNRIKEYMPLGEAVSAFQANEVVMNRPAKAARYIGEFTKRLDEMVFTPQRDWQVFGIQSYSRHFGRGHLAFGDVTNVLSFLAAIPFIAKQRGSNRVVSLHETLQNLEKEKRGPNFKLRDNLALLEEQAIDQLQNIPGHPLSKLDVYIQATGKKKTGTDQLTHIFDAYLFEKGYKNLKSKVTLDKDNHLVLNFEICDPCFDILVEYWDITSDMTAAELNFMLDPSGYRAPKGGKGKISLRYQALKEKLEAYSKEQRQAALKQLNGFYAQRPQGTLEECFKKRISTMTQDSWLKQAAAWSWTILGEGCFGFWLAFEPINIRNNNPDFSEKDPSKLAFPDGSYAWTKRQLIGVVVASAAYAVIKVGLSMGNYLLTWSRLKKAPADKNLREKFVGQFYDVNNLRDHLLTRLFVDCKRNDTLNLAENDHFDKNAFRPEQCSAIRAILAADTQQQVECVKLEGYYLRNNYVNDVYKRLKADTDPAHLGHKRRFSYLQGMMSMAITLSFIEWWIAAIVVAAGATAVGGFLLLSQVGIAVAVGGLVIGLSVAIYNAYSRSNRAEEKKRHEALMRLDGQQDDGSIDHSQSKIRRLQTLIAQNEKLKAFIISQGGTPITGTNAWKDNNQRRKKTELSTSYTWLKKGINRFCTAIGTMGSAILIMRLLPMPAYGIYLTTIGITGAAAVAATTAAFTSPVGLAILISVCLLWGGLCVYEYHQQSKLREAERCMQFIDDFAIRSEEANRETYLRQLGYTKEEQDNLLSEIVAEKTVPVRTATRRRKLAMTRSTDESESVEQQPFGPSQASTQRRSPANDKSELIPLVDQDKVVEYAFGLLPPREHRKALNTHSMFPPAPTPSSSDGSMDGSPRSAGSRTPTPPQTSNAAPETSPPKKMRNGTG